MTQRSLLAVAVAFLAFVGMPSSGAGPDTCMGRSPTIVGSTSSETIEGSGGDDVILAKGGNDIVRGRGGRDVMCGGRGNDRLYGGPGADSGKGGSGRDRCLSLRPVSGCERVVERAVDTSYTSHGMVASAGTVIFKLKNDGASTHRLVLEGHESDLAIGANGGSSASASISLAAGTYTIYCDIPGHRGAGMEASVTVA